MKYLIPFLLILTLYGCGGASTEARTDRAASVVYSPNTPITQTVEVRHKYSYVNLNEDGSKVAGLLELYGTNYYTQSATINGFTQSGRGTFYVNGDKVTLSRTSGIAINGVLDILKSSDNKIWLILSNGVTYVEDDNSTYLKSMTVTPNSSNANVSVNSDENSNQKIPDYIASEDDATNRDGDIVGTNDIIGKPIKIGNLEVAKIDFPKKMIWEDAKKACENLGSGWRLPTIDELNTLYLNKDKIGGFAKDFYWSSTELDYNSAGTQGFPSGNRASVLKNDALYVRAIRAF